MSLIHNKIFFNPLVLLIRNIHHHSNFDHYLFHHHGLIRHLFNHYLSHYRQINRHLFRHHRVNHHLIGHHHFHYQKLNQLIKRNHLKLEYVYSFSKITFRKFLFTDWYHFQTELSPARKTIDFNLSLTITSYIIYILMFYTFSSTKIKQLIHLVNVKKNIIYVSSTSRDETRFSVYQYYFFTSLVENPQKNLLGSP